MANQPKKLTASVRRVLTNPGQPVEAVHRFFYTRVGSDIELDVGYFDLPDLKIVVDAAKTASSNEIEATFFVTHRFALSPEAAEQLLEVATDIVNGLKQLEAARETKGG